MPTPASRRSPLTLALCAYLTERAEAGKATSTLDMSCTVIGTSTGSAVAPTWSPPRPDARCAAGIRDTAIILLGNASALRRAEIVALALADVEHKPAGLRALAAQSGHP